MGCFFELPTSRVHGVTPPPEEEHWLPTTHLPYLFLTASYDWDLHQLDIRNVFLHGDLQEEVYMEQPLGFVAQGEIGKVCRFRKSLYGLK